MYDAMNELLRSRARELRKAAKMGTGSRGWPGTYRRAMGEASLTDRQLVAQGARHGHGELLLSHLLLRSTPAGWPLVRNLLQVAELGEALQQLVYVRPL